VAGGKNDRVIGIRARRLVVSLTAVTLLAGCARPVSGYESPPDPAPVPSRTATPSATAATCPPEGVRLEAGEGDAAMGLRVLSITLVNCGSRTYRLNGYPVVRPLDEDRTALKVKVLHGVKEILGSMPWDGPPAPVTLEPGQRAGTAVAWRNTYDDIREPPVTVKFLDITPQVGRPTQTVEPTGGLDLGSTGRFGVSAWSLLPDSDTTGAPTDPPVPGASVSEPVETIPPLL
jgi:hypothetical protein